MNNSIAIVGIHTGIGKTIAAAVMAEAIGADYWKPVQAGTEERDTMLVKQLLTNGEQRVHDEAIILSRPMSPHAAAIIDGIEIDHTKFVWPKTGKVLLIETAGGILSPMSGNSTMADFVSYYKLPAILVAQNYLGSINHTLLSVEVLKSRGVSLLGIVMNGVENRSSETFIEDYAKTSIIARIPQFDKIDKQSVAASAAQIKHSLLQYISNAHH
ncbi:MAG: dethiobiotin synthase [Chitinophagales bacterium]